MRLRLILLALLASAGFADDPLRYRLLDVGGELHVLGGASGRAPCAVVFLGTECPISLRLLPRLGELAAEAEAGGIAFYGVVSDPLVTRTAAEAFGAEYGLDFPLLFDASGDLARALAPTHVPEAFVLLPGEIVYRGRVDDSFAAPGQNRAAATSHELADALAAVAAGGLPEVRQTEPVGCIFEAWKPDLTPPPSYTRDIAPLLRAHCVECHQPDAAAPFPLLSYEDAARRARMLAWLAEDKAMPPWPPAEGFGHFRDERGLRDEEIARLVAWAGAGAPRGPAEEEPPALSLHDGWTLGEPDLVLEMEESFDVPADGPDIYRVFVLPTDFPEDRDVVAVEYRPGAPRVVHHALFFLDTSGAAERLDAADEGPGYTSFGGPGFLPAGSLGGYAPGATAHRLPDGLARQLPAGARIAMQVHYHPSGKAESDRGSLGIHFADAPVEKHLRGLILGTRKIDIPAGEAEYVRELSLELPTEVELIGTTPHMHYLGREMKIWAELPDGGGEVPLVHVDDWDFRWQGQYLYAEPFRLPAGTVLHLRAVYDNSDSNPDNPSHPPQRVTWGEETTDEMCIGFFQLTTEDEAAYQRLRIAMFRALISGR